MNDLTPICQECGKAALMLPRDEEADRPHCEACWKRKYHEAEDPERFYRLAVRRLFIYQDVPGVVSHGGCQTFFDVPEGKNLKAAAQAYVRRLAAAHVGTWSAYDIYGRWVAQKTSRRKAVCR